jgi:2-polyprenyl-6-methoxyphenol hydroxylase-like FAD-dependent oxidoreductase
MAKVRKVLIVGGGIGGLSTALALRRAGVQVDLVEINSAWTVYHVGIVVQGNAVRAMAALGIAEKCVAAGFPYDGLEFRDLEGHLLADIHGVRVAGPGLPSDLGLTRPALHKVLSESALEAGTKVRLGTTFTQINDRGESVQVSFTDGTSGDYDLVVGADGCFSKVRSALFGDAHTPAYTGQGVWRYNVARPPQLERAVMVAGLETGKCGFIPLTADTGYILLVQAEPAGVRIPQEQLAESFRARLSRCTGVMAQLRDQITDASLVVYRPLQAVFVPAPWHKGRVLLIGDAVHATTPHLGQGAAQAMEDGVVLGELCAAERADLPIERLLGDFMKRRYERCKLIYDASLQLGEWEQHPTPQADPPGLMARMIQVFADPI